MNKDIAVIILAAGKGTRMESETAKVLHPVCNRPLLGYVLDLIKELKINRSVVVLGHQHQEVRKILGPGVKFVIQKELNGTGGAVKAALAALKGFQGTVLVLYGDAPLLTGETIRKLLQRHKQSNADATLLTAVLEKPAGYGRIKRDGYTGICGIIEEKEANDFEKEIKEINTGIVCFKIKRLAEALRRIKANNRKKEYYLTDTIGIVYKNGGLLESVKLSEPNEALGINSRRELAQANKIMQARINEKLMQSGVTIIAPDTAFISYGTRIGKDTVIYPFTVIEKNVKIGKRCSIGPFAHLREDTLLGDEVTAGNFLEIIRSRIGEKTFVKHFSYIGDSRIGRQVNIGAGTVTANFNGKDKNLTVVKDNAFIGSDTVLIAPVTVGKGAKTGAGSVVVSHKNIPGGATVAGVPARLLKRRIKG